MKEDKAKWKIPGNILAFAVLIILSFPDPSRADVTVHKTHFTLVLPGDWTVFGSDTAEDVIWFTGSTSTTVTSFDSGIDPVRSNLLDELDISISMGLVDPKRVIERGTKTLGKYPFSFYEIADTAKGNRLRFYRTILGDLNFNAKLVYVPGDNLLVSEIEQALTSLTLSGANAVRAAALPGYPVKDRPPYDALGRCRNVAPGLRLFRLPR